MFCFIRGARIYSIFWKSNIWCKQLKITQSFPKTNGQNLKKWVSTLFSKEDCTVNLKAHKQIHQDQWNFTISWFFKFLLGVQELIYIFGKSNIWCKPLKNAQSFPRPKDKIWRSEYQLYSVKKIVQKTKKTNTNKQIHREQWKKLFIRGARIYFHFWKKSYIWFNLLKTVWFCYYNTHFPKTTFFCFQEPPRN